MKHGFTLIELLVVVLIIGILAAVAMPQYQKAVEKSRSTEAITTLNNLYKQYELCRLSHADTRDCDMGETFEEYDVLPPGTKWDNECYETNDWVYCPPAQSDIRAYRKSPTTTTNNLYSSSLGVLTIWGYGYGASGTDCLGTISCRDLSDSGFCKKIGFTATKSGCLGKVLP